MASTAVWYKLRSSASRASSRPRYSLSMISGKRDPYSPSSSRTATVDSKECSTRSMPISLITVP